MSRAIFIFLCLGAVANARASPRRVQTGSPAAPSTSAVLPANARPIDGVAARIEDDIITHSEVRELASFQRLVDGHSRPRAELMEELANQWIATNEARVAYYPQPSEDDVNHLFEQLVAKFPSKQEFDKRAAEVGLTEADVRRLVAKQLFLARFLDYRFRPAAQIDRKQIEAYYNDELIPQLKSQGQPIPALDDVDDAIREVLVQRVISERSAAWLNETRARLKMDVMPEGEQP